MSSRLHLTTTLALLATAVPWAAAEDTPPPAPAPQSLEDRLSELDQEVRILKRKAELADEAAAAKSKTSTSASAGEGGFTLASADKAFTLKIGALVQTDGRFRVGDKTEDWATAANNWGPYQNTLTLAKVRPQLSGVLYQWIDYRVLTEFAGTVGVQDAYIDANFHPAARVLVGKAKVPFGLERGQSDTVTLFPERGLTDRLAPNRDTGVNIHGDLFPQLTYWVGVYNGSLDGSTRDTDVEDEKTVALRLWSTPLKTSDSDWLNGLSIGFGATAGYEKLATGINAGTTGYKASLSGTQFFNYSAANTRANGRQTRVTPQLYWSLPHGSILADAVYSTSQVDRTVAGVETEAVKVSAWQLAASWVLTGERPTYNGFKTKQPFAPGNGQWGAWELVARIGSLTVDDEAFDSGFAAKNTSASEAVSFGVGVNWHLNSSLKWQLAYEETSFTDGAGTLADPEDHESEQFLISRVSFTF